MNILMMLSILLSSKVDTEIPRNYEDMRWTSLAVKAFMALGKAYLSVDNNSCVLI